MKAYIALGSNLGDREMNLSFARKELELLPASRILAKSSVEETQPLGGREQPAYLNQMVLLETVLPPRVLLDACRAIEDAAGPRRHDALDGLWQSQDFRLLAARLKQPVPLGHSDRGELSLTSKGFVVNDGGRVTPLSDRFLDPELVPDGFESLTRKDGSRYRALEAEEALEIIAAAVTSL